MNYELSAIWTPLVRVCTTHIRWVVCRTSNSAYSQMYRRLIQPIDKRVVYKLFNALHEAKINYKYIFVYHCVAFLV
jgi:hypothetical protein